MHNWVPFGKYLLFDRVNVGGMAEVFVAKMFDRPDAGRLVAVKRIVASLAANRGFMRMLFDEAEIAGQLDHPNICPIFEWGCVDQIHFISMEYVRGQDLGRLLQRYRQRGQSLDPLSHCPYWCGDLQGTRLRPPADRSQGQSIEYCPS